MKTDIGYINVIVLYRFCSNTKLKDSIVELNSLLAKISEQPSVVLGDFNLNTLNCNEDTTIQQYVDTFMCSGFSPLINKPTHFKGQASTCIDQIWCNITSDNICSGILNVSTSAHLPIFASIPTNTESMFHVDESNSNVIKIHNICSKTIEKFSKAITSVNDKYLIIKSS